MGEAAPTVLEGGGPRGHRTRLALRGQGAHPESEVTFMQVGKAGWGGTPAWMEAKEPKEGAARARAGRGGAHPAGTALPSEITQVSSTQGRQTVVTGETLGEAAPIRQLRMTSVNACRVFLSRQELSFKS